MTIDFRASIPIFRGDAPVAEKVGAFIFLLTYCVLLHALFGMARGVYLIATQGFPNSPKISTDTVRMISYFVLVSFALWALFKGFLIGKLLFQRRWAKNTLVIIAWLLFSMNFWLHQIHPENSSTNFTHNFTHIVDVVATIFFMTSGARTWFKAKISAIQATSEENSTTVTRPNHMTNAQYRSQAIWSPAGALWMSLIFTPVFGCYIQAKNWRALGKFDEATISMKWFWCSVFILIGTTSAAAYSLIHPAQLIAHHAISAGTKICNIVYFLIWRSSFGSAQIRYVNEKCSESFPKKSLVKPFVIGIGVFILYILIVWSLCVALGFKSHKSANNIDQTSTITAGAAYAAR
jgi:hypothetical protein